MNTKTWLLGFKQLMLLKVPSPSRKVSATILVLLGLSCAFAFFGPFVVTLFWHIRFGFSVSYRTHTIRVPLEWVANVEPLDLQLSKSAKTSFSHPQISDFIDFEPLRDSETSSPSDLAKSWEALYWTTGAQDGDSISGPFSVGSRPNEILCMESFNEKFPDQVSASCIMPKFRLKGVYSGARKDIDAFLRIVRETR
jgi:hypothetical protein